MSNIVPFGYSFHSNNLPVPSTMNPLPPGQSQMITIFCTVESQEFLLETFNRWFDNWHHVIYRDHGTSSKQEVGFIVLEWEEACIDQLFLQILQSEESVLDYVVYLRNSEV